MNVFAFTVLSVQACTHNVLHIRMYVRICTYVCVCMHTRLCTLGRNHCFRSVLYTYTVAYWKEVACPGDILWISSTEISSRRNFIAPTFWHLTATLVSGMVRHTTDEGSRQPTKRLVQQNFYG